MGYDAGGREGVVRGKCFYIAFSSEIHWFDLTGAGNLLLTLSFLHILWHFGRLGIPRLIQEAEVPVANALPDNSG